HGKHLFLLLTARGEHHDSRIRAGSEIAQKFLAIAIGQTQIHDDQIRLDCRRHRNRFCHGNNLGDLPFLVRQALANHCPDMRIVFKQQQFSFQLHDYSTRGGMGSAGSCTVKTLPPPGRLTAVSVPPCNCTSWRAMARPRPAPIVSESGWPRTNLSNSRSRWAAVSGRPIPRSATVNCIDSPSWHADISICVPCGLYRSAFSTRLAMTRSISTGSHSIN